MRRAARLRLVVGLFVASLGAAGCEQPVPVLHPDVGKRKFTRCVLRNYDEKIFSSSFLNKPAGHKPGSEAVIRMYSATRVDVTIDKVPYQLVPYRGRLGADPASVDTFMKKYFVADAKELGLEKLEPAVLTTVNEGVGAVGMTKAQVYMALGPPDSLNFGSPALNLSIEDIMAANRWIYLSNRITPWWFEKVYVFDQDKLVQVIQ